MQERGSTRALPRTAATAIFVVAAALSACSSSSSGPTATPEDSGTGGMTSAMDATPSADAAPKTCATDDDCTPETECTGGKCVSKAVCPTGLEAAFESLRTKIFAVSCGTNGGNCHSHDGALNSGGLNLADDPYTALLGADGTGAKAGNIDGSEKNMRRVIPGDPDHSLLFIKLSTRAGQDPQYGSGMPFTDPGSVCPDALAKVRAWIAAGAVK